MYLSKCYCEREHGYDGDIWLIGTFLLIFNVPIGSTVSDEG